MDGYIDIIRTSTPETLIDLSLAVRYGSPPVVYVPIQEDIIYQLHPLIYFYEMHIAPLIPTIMPIFEDSLPDVGLNDLPSLRERVYEDSIPLSWNRMLFFELEALMNMASTIPVYEQRAREDIHNVTVRDFFDDVSWEMYEDDPPPAYIKMFSLLLDMMPPRDSGVDISPEDMVTFRSYSLLEATKKVGIFKIPSIIRGIVSGDSRVFQSLYNEPLTYYEMNILLLGATDDESFRMIDTSLARGTQVDTYQFSLIEELYPDRASDILVSYSMPTWQKQLCWRDDNKKIYKLGGDVMWMCYALGISPELTAPEACEKITSLGRLDRREAKQDIQMIRKTKLMSKVYERSDNIFEKSLPQIVNEKEALKSFGERNIFIPNNLYLTFVWDVDGRRLWAIPESRYNEAIQSGNNPYTSDSISDEEYSEIIEKSEIIQEYRRDYTTIPESVMKSYSKAIDHISVADAVTLDRSQYIFNMHRGDNEVARAIRSNNEEETLRALELMLPVGTDKHLIELEGLGGYEYALISYIMYKINV